MPTRYLKPGIRDSERIEALQSPDAENLYYRVLVSVDDFGRMDARPLVVKSVCFPIRVRATADNCAEWMQDLDKCGLIQLYAVDGKPYLQVAKWDNKPRAEHSKCPDPPAVADKRMQMLPVTETGTINRKPEPSTPADAGGAPSAPHCPHEEIIEAYHEILPMGRAVKLDLWRGQRSARLLSRWREDKRRQSLDWWRSLFQHIASSEFLTGHKHSPGRDPFLISLDWILKPENLAKIIEGEYTRTR